MRRGVVAAVATSIVLVFVAGVAGAWATTYDRGATDKLLPGTEIGGVRVGDMRSRDAIRLLTERLESPLHRPVKLRAGEVEVATTPWELGLRVDVRAAVRQAMGETGGSLPVRVWKRLVSRAERIVEAEPRWHDDVLNSAMEKAATAVAVAPSDAKIESSTGWVTIAPGKVGRELDAEQSRQAVRDAVSSSTDAAVRLATRDVPPAVGTDAFDQVILVRTGENMLYLYENGTIAKEWPVATGLPGYATPVGTWQITQKLVNPTWTNPGSAWARNMPARIGPGPNNPLGSRALRLNAPAILIHETYDRASIGYAASHGCIRMLGEHALELFNRVEVGTPVVVVKAGEPKLRIPVPVPSDPAQAAAIEF